MALNVGDRLGHYDVTALIGEGGMGQVYRATDTKLDRDVALKILPDAFVNDPERLARFQREAKVLASLNHPNIAAIHGLEESGDSPALVLEYVEGPTLQEMLSPSPGLRPSSPPQGERATGKPLPLEEALPIARQIAEALEAAHEQGIIHRDLKPANVKVKDDGTVKVLDFGLAKALGPDLSDLDAANSPTMTMTAAATKMGVIMGTAAYMSPEQARAGAVDRRADIWAFGVVLYEMLTGRQLFEGQTMSDTLASVLKNDPDWTTIPAVTPPSVRRLLRRALEKDRSKRLQHVGDARMEIDDADRAPEIGTPGLAGVSAPAFWQRPSSIAAIAMVVAALAGLAVWNATRGGAATPQQPARFAVTLPSDDIVNLGPSGGLALSPDGRTLVYVARRDDRPQLFRREIASTEIASIRGTEGANWPFFSPDGAWIGFMDFGGALKKVPLTGGGVVTLAEVSGVHGGASWGEGGTILLTHPEGIVRVPDAGGEPELLVAATDTPSIGGSFTRPQFLPGGEHLLFTHATSSNWSDAEIVTESLATGERRVLVRGGTDARYLPTGHLVYVADPSFLTGSARSNTRAASAAICSRGTTTRTITAASVISRRPTSTTAAPPRSSPSGTAPVWPRTPPIPSGSSRGHHGPKRSQQPPGSRPPKPGPRGVNRPDLRNRAQLSDLDAGRSDDRHPGRPAAWGDLPVTTHQCRSLDHARRQHGVATVNAESALSQRR